MATPFPFQAAAVLTAAQMNAITTLPTSTKTASHTLTISDLGTRVIMNSASPTTITVNTSIFGASDVVEILNIGAGVCTVTAGTCTVGTSGSLALVQNAGGTLTFISASASIFRASGVAAAASIASATAQTNSSQTTSSTTYADLSTVTSVTLTTGTSAFAFFHASSTHNENSGSTYISCAVSGASTVAASDDFCALNQAPSAAAGKQNMAGGHIFTGLTAGSNTFTIKYRVGGGGQTGTFDFRGIQVISL
jgi:hypothetical protein